MEREDQPITCVVRLWLPDRPGALGQVASRVGSVRGDVVGIDILERGGGRAVDELTLSLPDVGLIDLLLAEIAQVDGVAVEDIWLVDGDRPDAGIVALEVAARLAEVDPADCLEVLGRGLLAAFGGQWVVVLDGATPVVSIGRAIPDLAWLTAFLAGSRHLGADTSPGDIAWAHVGDAGMAVAVGRSGRPFHARERHHTALLARIAGAQLVSVSIP